MLRFLCLVFVFAILEPRGLQAGPAVNKEGVEGKLDNFVTQTPSQIKCKEYSKLVYENEKDTCKITENTTETAFATAGEMPHMVMIASEYLPFRGGKMDRVCGGALISDSYVLTSASCGYIVQMLNEEGDVFVRLGEVHKDFSDETETAASVQVIKIAKTFLHPKFNREEESPFNIALFQLAKPAELNAFVRPACLETTENLEALPLIVSDWKRVDENHTHTLRRSKAKAIPYEECVLKSSPEKHNTNSELCVNRESDILCGDDGANVLQTVSSDPNCSYHLVGFSGVVRCRTVKEPQKLAFLRLTPFISWIESTVWP